MGLSRDRAGLESVNEGALGSVPGDAARRRGALASCRPAATCATCTRIAPLREIDGMPFTVNSRVSGRVGDLEPDGALLRHTDL